VRALDYGHAVVLKQARASPKSNCICYIFILGTILSFKPGCNVFSLKKPRSCCNLSRYIFIYIYISRLQSKRKHIHIKYVLSMGKKIIMYNTIRGQCSVWFLTSYTNLKESQHYFRSCISCCALSACEINNHI